MILPALYHWSPRDRYHDILRDGLKPYVPPTVSTCTNPTTGNEVIGWPYICFGTTPSAAWGLSGDMDYVTEIEEWDLWQVMLADTDEVHFRSEYGNQLKEVRTYNAIPTDRMWWIATRSQPVALEAPPKRTTTRRKTTKK